MYRGANCGTFANKVDVEMKIDNLFNPFWDCIIKSSTYNPFEGIFEFEVVCDDKVHKVAFLNVSTFVYFNNITNTFEQDNYKELSSIVFKDRKATFSKSAPKWLTQYSIDFNVSIEVVRRTILIKCDNVKIDNELYLLEV